MSESRPPYSLRPMPALDGILPPQSVADILDILTPDPPAEGKASDRGSPTPFPTPIAARIRAYNAQIAALLAERQSYLQGAIDALGLTGRVTVSLDDGTYSTEA